LPYELVILDDCSTDETLDIAIRLLTSQSVISNWDVVKNDINLGIPKNTKKINDVITGNVLTHLSGDDHLSFNTIKIVNNSIKDEGLDPNSDLFISISPVKQCYGNSSSIVNYRIYKKNLFKSMIRKTFPFVKIGCSAKLLEMAVYPDNVGIWADWCWDVDICAYSKLKYYIINQPLYEYSVGLGIGSRTSEADLNASYLKTASLILSKYNERMDVLDKLYLLGEIYYLKGKIHGKVHYAIIAFLLYLFNSIYSSDTVMFKSLTYRYIPKTLYNLMRKK
jgi:glycosyltransferase involved in cell wall biosynthesis